ncbi:MAG: ASCH domain-containing protein [Mariprofundaceae bacterium]|nr:ASCH domain-containing protein [Mariprofundaceae bacterium]
MSAYPEKTCSIDRLVRNLNLLRAAIRGEKTQQRRNGVYGYPGETFHLNGMSFVVTGLERRRLGDMTAADARAEGYESLDAYRNFILRMHKGMQWNDNAMVWVHSFRRKDS